MVVLMALNQIVVISSLFPSQSEIQFKKRQQKSPKNIINARQFCMVLLDPVQMSTSAIFGARNGPTFAKRNVNGKALFSSNILKLKIVSVYPRLNFPNYFD